MPGEKYVLLKYTDYTKVPDSNFINSKADTVKAFSATGSSITLSDSFMSDTLAVYRCVKETK
ncbi:hypothetical protein [Aminipila terrae]|uniref:Ig-like domain-containing protein n=1 Tax=Aminipila terrae TaxID=2697030 RepID=A0A6P1MCB6_9FIRM|nr:hypothetical protein [Aminipila terrae]QHI72349.1 hypothetical protein Ami3637_07980 [Aminipila terrae]